MTLNCFWSFQTNFGFSHKFDKNEIFKKSREFEQTNFSNWNILQVDEIDTLGRQWTVNLVNGGRARRVISWKEKMFMKKQLEK